MSKQKRRMTRGDATSHTLPLRAEASAAPTALLLAGLLAIIIQLSLGVLTPLATAQAASTSPSASRQTTNVPFNPEVQHLRQMVHDGKLAATVHVLDSLGGTTILQFPLVPSGIKTLFSKATGLVTIVRGDRTNSTSDTVTVDVQQMPPNVTFTIFFIELANKPFGNVEYVADLTTREDGSGETTFALITLVAFAVDARHPNSSVDNTEGLTSGTNLEHLGMWFSSLTDAQHVLNDDSLTGTIFDGGNPPLHAGPQAMTDGQTAPVF